MDSMQSSESAKEEEIKEIFTNLDRFTVDSTGEEEFKEIIAGLKVELEDEAESAPEEEAAPEAENDEFSKEKNRVRMELYDWMQCVVAAVICGIFIFVFVGRTICVEGNSMFGTLHTNDRVIMSGLFYSPKPGDVVIFRPPTDAFGNTPLVKRVIATEFQTVNIDSNSGIVYVDGKPIEKGDPRYIEEGTYSNLSGPTTVPEGHIFVMGDNRGHSSDSRDPRVGMVDTRYVLGKVLFLLIPGADEYTPREWSRFGFVS